MTSKNTGTVCPECAETKSTMKKPFLPDELSQDDKMSPEEWSTKALVCLAAQLGMKNDFYYPLIGAAALINRGKP
jgi:hypothetical protein